MRQTDIDRRTARLLPVLVGVAPLAAFAPALDCGWVAWDDPLHFLNNPFYRGLGLAQLRWMFEGPHLGQYFPAAWLTLGLDYKLWGMEPYGYHATSVLIHSAAAVVFYFVALRLIALAVPGERADRVGAAAAVAALAWAVHPLRVESVVWLSERRDPMSALFYLLTILFYLRARERAGADAVRQRAASLLAYAVSLLSKAAGVTLPAALLILDAWPLGRLAWPPKSWGAREKDAVAEKIPYALLSTAALVAAWAGLRGDGVLRDFAQVGLGARLAQASYGFLFYLQKTLRPSGLIPVYEAPPGLSLADPAFAARFCAVLALASAAWRLRTRFPAATTALAFYAVTLAPVSGLVSNGLPHLAVDRYAYLPSLASSLLLGGAFLLALRRNKALAGAAAGAVLAAWIVLSRAQCSVWTDTGSLWSHAFFVDPTSNTALDGLAAVRSYSGNLSGAEELELKATRLRPDDFAAWGNLGALQYRRGALNDAADSYARAVALRPGAENMIVDEARTEEARGKTSAAVALYERALTLDGEDPRAWAHLGNARAKRGDRAGAAEALARAIALDPNDGSARVNLGLLLSAAGRRDEAIAQYRLALSDRRAAPAAHYNWGLEAAARGDAAGAARRYAEAIRLDPNFVDARINYGNALARARRWREAAAQYRAVLAIDPSSRDAAANLAAVRAAGRF